MPEALYVIVSGPPASGKSTLATALARALSLPLVAKDTIKESLLDNLDVADVDASRVVGRAAIAAMWAVARESSVGALLDCNFRRTIALSEIAELPGQVVEVFCRCDRDVALDRYRQRAEVRHGGHFDLHRTEDDLWGDLETVEPVAGGWPVVEVDSNQRVSPSKVARLVLAAVGGGAVRVDHPVLAVVAPHRLRRFCELVGVSLDDEIQANFTGWSKLVLLTRDAAVLIPRDHTQVDPLRREVAVLRALTEFDLPDIPNLRCLVEDDEICSYPIAVCDRLPGVCLDDIIDDLAADDLDGIFEAIGRATARWHTLPLAGLMLDTRDSLQPAIRVSHELAASPAERRATRWAVDQARRLEPVLVHGDIHEGQLLVELASPHRLTGVLDWQTAAVDHPFADFDIGEWGTAMWRSHRSSFARLRRRAWDAYAHERNLPSELHVVFEWFHAASHVARMTGVTGFPVEHSPDVTGSIDEARDALRSAIAAIPDLADAREQ